MTQKSLGFQADDRYRSVAETRIIDMIYLAGWACERQSTGRDPARKALEGLVEIGLPFRRSDGQRLFDPVETLNFAKQAGLDGRDGVWPNHIVHTARQLVEDLRAEGPRPFKVTLKRTFHVTPGQSLRLRLPLPLESQHLTGLTVEPFSDVEARLGVTRGRLEARLTVLADTVTIGAEVSFNAVPQGPDGSPPPDPVYLKPRDGMIGVSERIAELARRLAGPGTSPQQAIRAFWTFCLDEFRQSAVHYDQIDWTAPGDWLLDSGWGDCQLVGALFCSLCRAVGIPARLMGGHYLYRPHATNHYWAEAWIDGQGWLPFDFYGWELSRGGEDSAWRDIFYGKLEPRLTNQCLPLDFTGAVGVPLLPAWCILQSATGLNEVGVAMTGSDGQPVYTDFIAIR